MLGYSVVDHYNFSASPFHFQLGLILYWAPILSSLLLPIFQASRKKDPIIDYSCPFVRSHINQCLDLTYSLQKVHLDGARLIIDLLRSIKALLLGYRSELCMVRLNLKTMAKHLSTIIFFGVLIQP